MLAGRGAQHALVYGAERSGTAIPWLTGWPVTREAALVFSPGERDVLFVCHNNHVPNARRLAPDADVRPGGSSALAAALDVLATRTGRRGRLAVIGPVPARAATRLSAAASQVEFLDQEYTRLRLVKSAAELDWLRRGARMTDDAVSALATGARPGMTETELCALLESGYVAAGGWTQIHYLGVTQMAEPAACVRPSGRRPARWPPGTR